MEEGDDLNIVTTNVTTNRTSVSGGIDDAEFAQSDVILKPDGSAITRDSLLSDAINFYNNQYYLNISDVCDFSEGSELRTLHESFIVELFSLYKEMFRTAKMKFVLDSEDTYLDRLACEVHLTRNKATPARGSVTFTCNESMIDPVTIPANTIILSQDDGEEYILDSNVTIREADKPVNGTVHSKNAGSKYNKDPQKLTAFQNMAGIKYGISVTNTGKIVGGSDGESDESFRRRILEAKRNKAWGTVSQYNDLIKNGSPTSFGFNGVNYVHDIQFADPKELLKNTSYYAQHYQSDGKTKCTDCTRVVFVNGTMKPCLDSVVKEVEYFLTQQNNLVIGQLFHVEKCVVTRLYFKMELWCTASVSEETVYSHLRTYFDGGTIETKRGGLEYPGLNIREKCTKNDLLNVIESIPGVEQCSNLLRLTYNPNVAEYISVSAWIENGDNTYSGTYADYVFTKSTQEPSSINPWGWKNFSTLTPGIGKVLAVGKMSDVDETTEHIFDIDIRLVDEK